LSHQVPFLSRAVCLALVAGLVGCQSTVTEQAVSDSDDEARVARSVVERGPVKLTVEVEPARARLSDEPTLTLTIDYQKDVTIDKPPFGESLGDFVIRDFQEQLPQVRDDRVIVRQAYTLEPTRTGQLAIWPIRMTFTDSRPQGDGQLHTIESEGLTVEVDSVVDAEIPTLDELRPPADPVPLPYPNQAGIWGIGLTLFGFLLLALFAWWFWRRRHQQQEQLEQIKSPRELAYLELQQLLQDNWAELDVKRFYVELTGAVRRYIERTTGILAPEQTTEEFLREIGQRDTFVADERLRLQEFLESADLVKFAAHQPRTEDLQESFQRAQRFVGLEPSEGIA
jgi:hypothetical protein